MGHADKDSDNRSSIKHCPIQTVQNARQVPLLPVPQISDTIERYLQALKPLIPDFQYEKVASYAEKFLSQTANKLQILLEARARTRVNWITDWWLNDMYLEQNCPLPINSNPGMLVHRNYSRSRSENVTLIATIIKSTLRYKTKVENNELHETSGGQMAGSHLCMNQYRNLFTRARD
ncbi:Oidioi.mRNA.OKI2018_I69.chr2.g5574.t1.cds [Oikopleura dioica]|uniref:Oidioi.mRNA.OKI2018_I69.chr2.g5574.t1.cds n=1 Tax=Oikopleura dioica TaxID=34765 RepID=A0ABN7T538_OIKDI|nr:Oidioi.mRNA.OKI2018_I69.chr2.g5574.t1.cds [Oikopleura dioica]